MIQKCQRTYDIYQLIVMPDYPNANFANGRKWMQIPPFVIPNASFVIPNTVRNLAPEKERDSSLTL